MARTVATYAEMTRATNVAAPHAEVDDTVRAIAHRDIDNVGPAGSVYSSAHDMARWVRAVLDSTRVAGAPGGRLVSDSAFRQLLTPQFLVPEASYYPAARLARPHFRAYGLGWFLQDYRGRLVAMHTGSIDGMSAIVGLLPEERVGVVVLANLDHAELRHALMYDVFDRFLGAPAAGAPGAPDARLPRDWSRALRPVYDSIAARGREAERRAERDRVAGTRPTLPLSAYAGSYADSLYGAVTVAVERDRAGRERLALRGAGAFAGPLEHWHYDTFRARWADRVLGTSLVVFTLDPSRRRVTGVSVGGAGVLARRADERAP
jgi:hypothetical protein